MTTETPPADVPSIIYFEGEPLEALSRDKLLEAARYAFHALQDCQTSHEMTLNVWRAAQEGRRRVRAA